jgi:3-phosphoinositide dependent protein kinase-1
MGVLRGVSYIHARSIIHGDLKGVNILLLSNDVMELTYIIQANVVVDNDGRATKICDFGSSLIGCDCYTGPEEQDGTAQWDSPELFEDNRRTTCSDIWAFGCVVLEVCIADIL